MFGSLAFGMSSSLPGTHVFSALPSRQLPALTDANADGNQNHNHDRHPDPDSIDLDEECAKAVVPLGELDGRQRKRKRSFEGEGHIDKEHGAEEVFFRISHTQLGRHKLFHKGAVATYDLGVQIIPALEYQPETAYLDMSEAGVGDGANLTKLAMWMSEKQVRGEGLRKCWKVWRAGPSEGHPGAQSTYLWNLQALDLASLIPNGHNDDTASLKQFLESMIHARAFGETRLSYVPDPDDVESTADTLLLAGIICRCREGFRLLVRNYENYHFQLLITMAIVTLLHEMDLGRQKLRKNCDGRFRLCNNVCV